MAILDTLRKAGIDVAPYARGPLGKTVFSVGVDPVPAGTGRLRLWAPDDVPVEVATSRKHHQAALHVKERPRSFTRRAVIWASNEADATFRFRRGDGLAIGMPPNTRYIPGDIAPIATGPRAPRDWQQWTALVTAQAPRTSANFLVGIDETHHFVSILPRRAESVVDAHDALRPKDVPEGSLRQGEWFFVPVPAKLRAQLDTYATRPNTLGEFFLTGERVSNRHRGWSWSEPTSHRAMQAVWYRGRLYANGYIIETRKGRHSPLFLPGWHAVRRNRERATTTLGQRAVRSYD